MIQEDFVSFEQAQKLRELGFDRNVYAYYDNGHFKPFGAEIIDYVYTNTVNTDSLCCSCNSLFKRDKISAEVYGDCYDAPTLSQACKWLRERHNIHIQIESVVGKRWAYDVVDINLIQDISGEYISRIPEMDCYPVIDTYEQAQSAGIDVALRVLEEEKQRMNTLKQIGNYENYKTKR